MPLFRNTPCFMAMWSFSSTRYPLSFFVLVSHPSSLRRVVSWIRFTNQKKAMTVVDQPRQRSSHQTPKRIINVVGAVIVKDGKILCAQRGEGRSLAGCWEFPGGKIEPHETARQALHREIEEELMCDVEVADKVCTSSYDYDFGTVVLTSFICHLLNGTPHLTEHHEMRWLVPSEISSLDWAPADRETVRLLSTMNLVGK